MKEQIDELTLLLLYLTSFKEDYGLSEAQRSWKGYPFESLNELAGNNFIRDSKRSKSVYLTDEGIEEAKKLIKKYNIKVLSFSTEGNKGPYIVERNWAVGNPEGCGSENKAGPNTSWCYRNNSAVKDYAGNTATGISSTCSKVGK